MILIQKIEDLIPNERLINIYDFKREYYFVSYKLTEYYNKILVLRKSKERGKEFLLTISFTVEEFKSKFVKPFNKNDFSKLGNIKTIISTENSFNNILKLLSSKEFNSFFEEFKSFELNYKMRSFDSTDFFNCTKYITIKNKSRKSIFTFIKKNLNILAKRGFIIQKHNTYFFNEKLFYN